MPKNIQIFTVIIVLFFTNCSRSPKNEERFFNGKDLNGWSAKNMTYWSVEDSAIVGRTNAPLERNQFLWSDIKVKDFYLSLDVKMEMTERNAGIQFRAVKADESGQAKGYQADVGFVYDDNAWGTLYHEHGRGLLNGSDLGSAVVVPKEWNHYEILAVDNRIWIAINGKIISATEDIGGEAEGYIALQIHADERPEQTVHYRLKQLIHDPEIEIAGKKETELNGLLRKPFVLAEGQKGLELSSGDIIAFTGGTNIVDMQRDGYLETLLHSAFKSQKLSFLHLGWEGDTVFEQFRDVGFGSWSRNLDSLNANVIFAQFGQMEALQGEKNIPSFIDAYKKLLKSVSSKNRKIFVLSPIPFEPAQLKIHDSVQWNNPIDTTAIERYFRAIQIMAQAEGYTFVDIYSPLLNTKKIPFTYDGIHLTNEGQKRVAEAVMKALNFKSEYTATLDRVRQEIIEKNNIWFDYWRPGNWAFLHGDRTEQAFSRDPKDGSKRIFPEEIKQFGPIYDAAEKRIEDLFNGEEKNESQETGYTIQQSDSSKTVAVDTRETASSIAQELASFQLDKDYQIDLFASEQLGIAEPCTMRWDEKGRLWVLCIPTYPQPLPGKGSNDKLVILEDRNKDGKADHSTVFADGLNIPLGFELGHGGVYLGEQTRLLFLKDTNSDLKSDVRQTLLSGFGTHDSHQTINSFTWSPGGELFFAQGLSIHSSVETPWGIKKGHRGGIWRYRPLSHELENILDQSTASDNPWGMSFGDWGELFTKSNDTGVYYTTPAGILSEHKALVPEIGATVIKSGIIEIPRTKHLPANMRGDFLIAGYYNNKVERMKVKDDGAGFKARLIEPLLSSTSKNFRPVDIKVGPDGAIYVLDWYNPVIGHYQASLRDPMRDKTHGRVWRITARGRPLVKAPELSGQSAKNLLENLRSDEYWVRQQVKRLLASRDVNEVVPAVHAWVKELNQQDKNYEHNLFEALAVYESQEFVHEPLVKKLLKARKAGARGYAAQVTGRWAERLANPLQLIRTVINDRDPRVRLQALVACSYIRTPEAMTVAAQVLNHPMDKFLSHAFDKTVFSLKPVWDSALRQNKISFQNNRQLATVISIAPPQWYQSQMYHQLLQKGGFPDNTKSKLLSEFAKSGNADDIDYIFSLPSTRNDAALIEAMGKRTLGNTGVGTVGSLKSILGTPGPENVLIAAIRLAKAWEIGKLTPALLDLLRVPGRSPAVVSNTIDALVVLQGKEVLPLLNKYVGSENPRQVRIACIRGMSRFDLKGAAAATVQEIKRSEKDLSEMRDAVEPIVFTPGGIAALTAEIKRSELTAAAADVAVTALGQKNVSDMDLLNSVRKFSSQDGKKIPVEFDEKYVAGIAANIKQKGDFARGKKIYDSKLSCNVCHKIGDKGGNIGPNLSSAGSGLTVSDLITEVLWPNKNIKEGYYTIALDLKNGEKVQGIRVFETPSAVATKSTPSSTPVSVSKEDIMKITDIGSAMPAGAANGLSEEEFADLIRYLSELKNK